MLAVNAIRMGGVDVLPLIEGGKGVSISNGNSSGNWAATGGVGTFSAVNADSFAADGTRIPQVYHGKTRRERHEELIAYAVQGALTQARRAYDLASGRGRIHANILWEMGGAERVITERPRASAKGMIHGITCGAGMPYRLSDIAAKFGVHYYPIVSSARAFNALWKRAYSKPRRQPARRVWSTKTHGSLADTTGLSNGEHPTKPEDPFPARAGPAQTHAAPSACDQTPIIMAGGVWCLEEWQHWIENPDLGPMAFQFGTQAAANDRKAQSARLGKQRLMTLERGRCLPQSGLSPTGFYSSAVNNNFMKELRERSDHQVAYSTDPVGEHVAEFGVGPRRRLVYLTHGDLARVKHWIAEGFTEALRTPDTTLIFVTPERAREIIDDQVACMGCLSTCRFSNWSQERSRAYDRQEERPAQLLHPEDTADGGA